MEAQMADSLLSGYRALDLTDEKGYICGKILGSLGVDVIKVEPPEGDIARSYPPFYHDIPGPERSLYWYSFNTDKRGITLNLETDKGRELLFRLVKKSDFLLESYSPGYMDSLGLSYEALSLINPGIIMTSITPFGQKGPYSSYKGCDLVVAAMGGLLENMGYPDRPPVKESLESSYFQGCALAALGTIVSHYYREMTGEGQQVDVSLHECVAYRGAGPNFIYQLQKKLFKRAGQRAVGGSDRLRPPWVWPCKDGDIFWTFGDISMESPTNQMLSQWLDDEGLENPFHTVKGGGRQEISLLGEEIMDIFTKAISKLFLKHTRKEITDRGLKTEMRAWGAVNPAELLEDPHLAFRHFWKDVDYPQLGMALTYPRHFFVSNETENYVRHPAPLIGEHNDAVYGKELGLSSVEMAALKKANVI
jgi:crotonobetainyl-CoA:carnitine CoA-transferase CaiB-like acyl-CoA transferase